MSGIICLRPFHDTKAIALPFRCTMQVSTVVGNTALIASGKPVSCIHPRKAA